TGSRSSRTIRAAPAPTSCATSRAAARAQGLRRSRLVAVQGADVFWRRLGYRPASADAAQQQALHAVYGDEAQLMERTAFARS
ncbi:hypothetical protein ACQCQW_14680, partial [Ralstonia pseudosolanacearum]